MSFLIPIQYHKKKYPSGLTPKIKEVAAHFDIEEVDTSFPCSLHTEYPTINAPEWLQPEESQLTGTSYDPLKMQSPSSPPSEN